MPETWVRVGPGYGYNCTKGICLGKCVNCSGGKWPVADSDGCAQDRLHDG